MIFGKAILLFASLLTIQSTGHANNRETSSVQGMILFQELGCSQCHGADGASPADMYVPIIRGISSAKIISKISRILDGSDLSIVSRRIHDAYCFKREDNLDSCLSMPSDKELRIIADWLSSLSVLPKKKHTPQQLYLTSTEAFELLKQSGDKPLFVDIRTRAEVAFVGLPSLIDVNIPFASTAGFKNFDTKKQTFRLTANVEFVSQVEKALQHKGLNKDSRIILMCRSGVRSAKAARLLYTAGYQHVYSVVDGFEGDKLASGHNRGQRLINGWKNSGLPWSYILDQDKLY